MDTEIKAFFDGGCKKNPGKTGSWGFVITDPWIEDNGIIRGQRITNNIAEYNGLLSLLKELKLLRIEGVNIYGDSKMVVNIVNRKWGFYKKEWNPHRKNKDLKNLAIKCRELLLSGGHILSWVPREENTIADGLADSAM